MNRSDINKDINTEIRKSRFYRYQIAMEIGVTEFTFTRWFRRELTPEQKEQVRDAIRRLKEQEA